MTGSASGILAGTGLRFQFQAQGLDKDTFNLVHFEFEEALSTPFEVKMTLLSAQHDLSAADIVDLSGLMQWAMQGEIKRQVHGIVKAFSKGDTGHHHTVYHITLVPALSRLKLRQNSRIFQAQSPVAIISTILSEMNILDVAFNCDPALDERVREYCVQYRETDFEFISRLAAEEGLFYHFEHTDTRHILVFSDSTQKLSNIGFPFPYNALSGGVADTPFMGEFAFTHQVRPASVALKDASFHNPAYSFLLESHGETLDYQNDVYEHFDFPGRFKDDDSGQVFTQARLDYLRRDAQVAVGKSNIMQASAGYKFDLAEHIDDTFNRDWLLVRIKHQGIQGAGAEGANTSVPTTYHNEVTSIPASSAWQAKPQPKPRVTGPQMATVVGPEGEEIFCDEFGRVKLQFPWDRYSNGDDISSCWVRVSQGWTGGQYGMMSVPRIGHEVIVSFVEGDPDQPIITGRTHNAINLPPYALPDHQTRTVLKTQSHKGEGSNELHFEDEAGEEVVYFHAQKDMQQLIENDQSLHVLANQHWDVTQDRVTQVTNNDHLTLEADSHTLISKDSMLAVKASHHQKVSKKQLMKVGSEVHLKSKGELVLDAGSEITLSGGGSFLKVDPAGVHLVGAKVNLNSGGGAGTGTACKVKKPLIANALDEAICPETGEVIKQAATLQVTDIEEVEFDYTAIEMVQTQGVMSGSAEGVTGGGASASNQAGNSANSSSNSQIEEAEELAVINTRTFPDNDLQNLLQANNQHVMLLNVGEAFEALQALGWDDVKSTWKEVTNTTTGQIVISYGLNGKDVVTTSMIISQFGNLGIKATTYVNKAGTEMIKFTGYAGIRKVLNAPAYGLKNMKVVQLGIGKYGLANSIKQGGVLTFYVAAAYRTLDYILNDEQELARYLGSLATDVVKIGIVSAITWGVGAGVMALTSVVSASLVAVVLVGFAASVGLNYIDEKYGITDKVVESLEKAQQEVIEKAREIEDGFWDLGAMLIDGMLEQGKKVIQNEIKGYIKNAINEIQPRLY
ncbi:type VI secretion system Vgr family protein [uncultured Shewanella sp.]|uniref:type VI secretion system Vgr family protein n=1 Tax=uncultured Shewanella sp. TaxID=173975 RepID=UPI0026380617|nr:type VI secretion system tip protein TssI/VgrG [uncultured Shewanella sp.]